MGKIRTYKEGRICTVCSYKDLDTIVLVHDNENLPKECFRCFMQQREADSFLNVVVDGVLKYIFEESDIYFFMDNYCYNNKETCEELWNTGAEYDGLFYFLRVYNKGEFSMSYEKIYGLIKPIIFKVFDNKYTNKLITPDLLDKMLMISRGQKEVMYSKRSLVNEIIYCIAQTVHDMGYQGNHVIDEESKVKKTYKALDVLENKNMRDNVTFVTKDNRINFKPTKFDNIVVCETDKDLEPITILIDKIDIDTSKVGKDSLYFLDREMRNQNMDADKIITADRDL